MRPTAHRSLKAMKAAVLRLLWQRSLSTDLSRPLDADSVLEVTR